ncbi:MAG: hypothetical protein F4Z04_07660 [Acidobacteria bacterium]|nr:hypothetical protein [Acidobacteriota bacterium]
MNDPTHTRERRKTIAVCAGVTLLAATLAFWWSTTNRYRLTGDEPHYFILAASLLRDSDVDVRNNFDEDIATGEIYGSFPDLPSRHVSARDGREYSLHAPGLGALLVLPFAIGGPLAGRLLLCLLITPILGWACWRWFNGRAPPGDVALATAGVLLCPVILLGSGQVYSDLLAGVLIVALAVWLWDGEGQRQVSGSAHASGARSPAAWTLFGLVAGALPWLHMKYLATTALFGLFAAWQARRESARRTEDGAGRSWGHLAGGALLLIGPATFFAYQMATHGQPLAGLGNQMTDTPYLRVVEMFIGRHIDQSHGLLWHQPLFLPGLVALGWLIRKRHPLTIPWLLLYASLLVPAAVTNRWGGAPLGRLNWAGMWLWLVPIGVWLHAERDNLDRYVRPAVLAALAYQVVLAFRWVPEPTLLFNYASSGLVWARDSLFPLPVRYVLPHFYGDAGDGWWVVRYVEYLPNLVWVLATALLIVTGLLWSAEGRRRLRPVWIGGFIVAAFLLPVEPTADREGPHDDGLHDPMMRSLRSTFARRFEAERMFPTETAARTTRFDDEASDGRARAADPDRPDGVITFGPYLGVDAGRYRIEAAMRLETPSDAAPAAWLNATTDRGRVSHGRIDIAASRLPADGSYTTFSLSIDAVEPLGDLEFVVGAHPGVDLVVDYIDLIPVLP